MRKISVILGLMALTLFISTPIAKVSSLAETMPPEPIAKHVFAETMPPEPSAKFFLAVTMPPEPTPFLLVAETMPPEPKPYVHEA